MNQQQTNTPIIIAVLVIIAVVGGLFLLSQRQPRPPAAPLPLTTTPIPDQTQPGPVQVRVIAALRDNQPGDFRQELGPSLRELFAEETFRQGMQTAEAAGGPVQMVEVIKAPVILTADPWNGQWADGCVRLARQKSSQHYVLRYYIEDGRWWLFATIEVDSCN